jgi:hypothetical protein
MNGIHEVRGSIPLVSTNKINKKGADDGALTRQSMTRITPAF